MTDSIFYAFYASDLQQTYSLAAVPLAFLVYLFTAGRRRAEESGDPAAGFIWTYAVVFSCETILDCVGTTLISRWLGIHGTGAGTALLVAFVLIGDWRVLLLVFRFARPERAWVRLAALWTLPVPLLALAIDGDLRRRWPGLPEQTIWLVYELAFTGLAIALRSYFVPRWTATAPPEQRSFLRALLAYVTTYYALWALADVTILVFGLEAGWALRVVPNQLYYSFFVPFVFWRFFRAPPVPGQRPLLVAGA